MRNQVIGGLAIIFAVAAAPTNAGATTAVTVNCSNPAQTISSKLNTGFDEITVVGTCTETVEIRRDDVTIKGSGGAVIAGKVVVDGAGRINIKNLTVQGVPTDVGILLNRGASAVLDHVTVQNAADGVKATGNSYLEVVNGSVVENNTASGIIIEYGSGARITNSTCRNNQFDGLSVGNGGSAELKDNTVEGNGPDGDSNVFVDQNGFARLIGNTIVAHEPAEALTVIRGGVARLAGGNTISGEGFATVDVALGATLLQRNGHDTINGPVQIHRASNADFRGDVDINGDLNIDYHSIVTLRSADVAGSVALARDSGLSLEAPASVGGSVECADDESSFSSNEDPPNVAGGVNCSGF